MKSSKAKMLSIKERKTRFVKWLNHLECSQKKCLLYTHNSSESVYTVLTIEFRSTLCQKATKYFSSWRNFRTSLEPVSEPRGGEIRIQLQASHLVLCKIATLTCSTRKGCNKQQPINLSHNATYWVSFQGCSFHYLFLFHKINSKNTIVRAAVAVKW